MDFASWVYGPGSGPKQSGSITTKTKRTPLFAGKSRGAGRPDRLDLHPWQDLESVIIPLFGPMAKASRRILHDEALVEDAIQETLLAYWVRSEQPENPRAWLLHAVTLRSLHLARSRRRRQDHERRASLGRTEGSRQDDPARSLDYADLMQVLDESLGRLPAKYRAVFLLWAFEEMDYAGIAEALQVPIGTVRSRLNRTRKAIRESFPESSDERCLRYADFDPATLPRRSE